MKDEVKGAAIHLLFLLDFAILTRQLPLVYTMFLKTVIRRLSIDKYTPTTSISTLIISRYELLKRNRILCGHRDGKII